MTRRTGQIFRLNLIKPRLLEWVLLVVMCGCSSAGKLRVRRDPSYGGKLERVLIVYNPQNTRASLGKNFSNRLISHLKDAFARQNVTSESVEFDGSALDRGAPIRAAEAQFQPKEALYFRIARFNSNSSLTWMDANDFPHFSNSMLVTLEFEMVDSKTQKTIWRAEVDYYSVPDPKKVATQVAEGLRAAKML